MALNKLFRIMLATTLCLAFFSCKKNKPTELQENGIRFDSFTIQKEKHLFNDTSKANATIELKLLIPAPNTPKNILSLLEKNLKITLFGQNDPSKSIKDLAEAYAGRYLKEYSQLEAIYVKDHEEYKKKQSDNEDEAEVYEPMESAYSYQHTTGLELKFNKANMLSYVIHRYDYTGGAHGMNTDSCYTIMLNSGAILKQEDLFEEEALDKVATLIVNHIIKDNKDSDIKTADGLEEIGFFSVKEIYPNGNFYVTDKGITWSYNPYDIAAYALGTIKTTVPFSELKPLLKPNHPLTALVN